MPSIARRRTQATALTLGAIALAALTTLLVQQHAARATRSAPVPFFAMPATLQSEVQIHDGDIAFYTKRVSEDRESALDRLTLAGLLFSRSRATGSTADIARAESLARESIGLRRQRNGPALEMLATILMSRHEFGQAREFAARADSLEPSTASHLSLLGEIELELGEYSSAAEHFRAVRLNGKQFTVTARLARWYELTGHADVARALLKHAIVDVNRRDDLPQEQAAWFHYRLGELELRTGHGEAADAAFRRALARNPDDVRALGGLARSALLRGDWKRVIEHGDRALAVQIDPTILGALSTASTALGDTAAALGYARAMSATALTQPGAIHRAWGLFLLDHGSRAEQAEVLRRARRELRERHDVYGHDLLAWALYRDGRIAEAREQMRAALAQGTEDVQLVAHANALGVAHPDSSGMRAPTRAN